MNEMNTKYLDKEIDLLEIHKRLGDLSSFSEEKLTEFKEIKEAINFTDSSAELPTKEEINLAANECSDINGIICEDEYWVIAKNDGFKEGADFVINKLK